VSQSKQDEVHGSGQTVIDERLHELLVCPVDKLALRLQDSTLVCTECQRVYPIEQGIPYMLVDRDK
jgi:uncharacterized protein YbaR (Trm112 family)